MVLAKQFSVSAADNGSGKTVSALHRNAGLIAIAGARGRVTIYNKMGKVEHQFSATGVVAMQWDSRSDVLAIVAGNSTVQLYNNRTRTSDTVDMKLSDLCFFSWSTSQPQFAVGSKNGQFVLYNRNTRRLIPVVGTHSQRISDGTWMSSAVNQIVMVSSDRTLSVSNDEGNTAGTCSLGGAPLGLCIAENVASPQGSAFAAVNLGNAIQVVNLKTFTSFNAQFQSELGTITAVDCSNSGLFVIGFASGNIGGAVLEGNTLTLRNSVKVYGDAVKTMAYNESSGLAAIACENVVRLCRITDEGVVMSKDEAKFEMSDGKPNELIWSRDGQQLLLSTRQGATTVYSQNVLSVSAACGTLIFSFISTRTVGVKNLQDGRVVCSISIDSDPTFMSAGMGVLAVGNNNQVSFYDYYIPNSMPYSMEQAKTGSEAPPTQASSSFVRTVEYPSPVTDVKVNSRLAAALYDGRLQLHPVREKELGLSPAFFPQGGDTRIIATGLSETLLLYATSSRVCVFALHNLQQVAAFACNTGLKRAFPNPTCTRVAYIDDNNVLFNLNPVTEVANQAEGFEPDQKTVLWDQTDATVFITHDGSKCITFVNAPHSRHGATCESVLAKDSSNSNLHTPLPADYKPVSLFRGMVVCQSSSGSLDSVPLRSHNQIYLRTPNPEAFYNNFSLNRLRWSSNNISTPQEAEDLAVKSLHMLDIELAIRVYRQLSQPSLVLCLEKIRHIHEKNLLLGHVSMIMGYLKDAQNFFLRSSQPVCALQMRRDMMQWEQALALADRLSPEEVPIISKEYAQQLEYRGEYVKALEMYQRGNRPLPTGHSSTELSVLVKSVEAHNELCLQGTARCYIRTGNVAEALTIAVKSVDNTFVTECAKLFEDNGKYEEAAQLFEQVGNLEKAATLYIERSKNLKAAARLLPQIKSRNIIGLYAQGKEAEGSFIEAEKAYLQAEDWDNAVRIKLEQLNDLHGAYIIVRQTRSPNAAAMVARKCQAQGEYGTAVEFLVLAKSINDAFEMAKAHDAMFNFESSLLSQVQLKDGLAPLSHQPDFAMVADYYEKEGKPGQAGMYYHISGNFSKALKKYLESGEPDDIEKAVEVVGKAHSDGLTNKLIDYLMGEVDGEPKNPSYIFKLYLSLGSFEKAAKTSVIIATKEQEIGNYKVAHSTLLEAYCILRKKGMRVPNDLRRILMLLHSYIIVKDLMKVMKDDETACRMLLRVSRNIQKFPKHITTIVTSTILQCVKANFKKSAFDLSCFLIQNEKYRSEMNEKSRKKIEGIVRRRGKEEMEDPAERTSPCPFCDAPVAETELDCGACKNTLPFCVVTGKHVVKSDYATTPCCQFPAIYSALMMRLKETPTCPMCDATIDVNKVQREAEPDLRESL